MSRPFLMLLAVLLLCGCSNAKSAKDGGLADVRGTVTFCGAPADAEIIFEPIGDKEYSGGRPSTAATDDDGEFVLFQSSEQLGVKPGENRISIKVYGIADREITRAAPGTTLMSTQLTRTVKPGENRFDFVLTF